MNARNFYRLSIVAVCFALPMSYVAAAGMTFLLVDKSIASVVGVSFSVLCAGYMSALLFLAFASIKSIFWNTAKIFLLFTLGAAYLATMLAYAAVAVDIGDSTFLLPLMSGMNIVMSVAAIAFSAYKLLPAYGDERLSIIAFRFIHLTVAVYAVVITLSLESVSRDGWILGAAILVTLVWTELTLAMLVLIFLNRHKMNTFFAATGAISATFVFVSALIYAPTLYGWDLRPLGWYAILATSVPVLLFFSMFLQYAPGFARASWLRQALAVGVFLVLACGAALQMAVASPDDFRQELESVLEERITSFHLSEITNFEWDVVEIYGPYTSPDTLSQPARESVDAVTLSLFGVNDGFALAVFINEDKAVRYEIIPSIVARFSNPLSVNPIVWKYEESEITVNYKSDTDQSFPLLTTGDGM